MVQSICLSSLTQSLGQSICHSISLFHPSVRHLNFSLQSACLSVIQYYSSLLHLHPFICQSVSMFYLSLICHLRLSVCQSIYLFLSYIFSLSFYDILPYCIYFISDLSTKLYPIAIFIRINDWDFLSLFFLSQQMSSSS